jgi:hypothetical protein
MVQSMMTIASTMPAATTIGTAIAIGNIIDPEKELGNATPKVWSVSIQLHQVRYMNYGCTLNSGGTDSWRSVASRTIQRETRHQYWPLRI